jgi:hypothetical protein
MPIDYYIDTDRKIVITRSEGRVTLPEFRSYQERLVADPNFDPDFNQLINSTRVTEAAIPATEGAHLAERPIFSKTSRRAWVVSNTEMARMKAGLFAAQMSVHSESLVFHDVRSALDWLGIDIPS